MSVANVPLGMNYKWIALEDFERMADDDRWVAEQKLDGIRCIATVTPVGFYGRNAQVLSSTDRYLHSEVGIELAAIGSLFPGVVLDGELLGDVLAPELYVYDILATVGGGSTLTSPFSERRMLLAKLMELAIIRLDLVKIHLVVQAVGTEAKRALFAAVDANRGEGIMLKNVNGRYHPGLRTADGLKVKFLKTADVIVTGRNTAPSTGAKGGLKENAALAVMRDGKLWDLGTCSMGGKEDAQPGDVAEVRYLYLGANEHLVQPEFLKIRRDKRPEECGFDQLIPTNREVLVS